MSEIIECIPNISEGRDKERIEKCVDAVRNVKGCRLLNYSSDPSHNRTVITFIGGSSSLEEACVELVKTAASVIDLNHHHGEHPRMGAVDVMPFVPIKDADTADCVRLSGIVGERIWKETGVPVFLYEQSARKENRRNLSVIRQGQFEGMSEKLLEDEWEPDFGERKPHPTAGVTAVGARPPLIAYNVNLDTDDIEIARDIAGTVRERDGGYESVKALGFMLEERNIAQVSMNLTDFRKTPIHVITEAVKREAQKRGVAVIGTELVGMSPMEALIQAAEYYLQIEDFDFKDQVIENHIL